MGPDDHISSDAPLLAVSYDDMVRAALVKSLAPFAIRVEACATFCEGERIARQEPCRGLVVDLSAMIKAKSEEKIVAYSLAAFFPTMRVRAMGPMIVPMTMAGDAKQEKSLGDFINKTCAAVAPRRLRGYKRHPLCLPTWIDGHRGFTLNLSWSGAFIADMNPERFAVGQRITVGLPDFGLDAEMTVVRIQNWGEHRPPGIGVELVTVSQELEENLRELLHSSKESDHDRQIT
jgi:hypothetical protein